MSLKSQHNVRLLVGTFAERPDSSSIDEVGTLYWASDFQLCYILAAATGATGVHAWEEFCSSATAPTAGPS